MDIWSLGCLVIVSRLHQFAKQIKWMEIYECLLGLAILQMVTGHSFSDKTAPRSTCTSFYSSSHHIC